MVITLLKEVMDHNRVSMLGTLVADVLLAVNRLYGKSDYIPCIIWGRNAWYASGLAVGSRVEVQGRLQSREYVKRGIEQEEIRTAYEVSVGMIDEVEED